MATKKKTTGRPPASKNGEEALEYPSKCPHCGSLDLVDVPEREIRRDETPGVDQVTGRVFDAVERRARVCRTCDVPVPVRRYILS